MAEVVALVDYGAGNLHSVMNALKAAGAENVSLTSDPYVVRAADRVVLPGVGSFKACAEGLRGVHGMVEAMEERVFVGGAPFLGICVGMQWLFEGSEESPDCPGLGVLPGRCTRLVGNPAEGIKVPHVGWNALVPPAGAPSKLLKGIADGSQVYFTHSYAGPVTNDCVAATTHGTETFSAAVERGRIYGVQFHPEKSSDAGLRILTNFLEVCR